MAENDAPERQAVRGFDEIQIDKGIPLPQRGGNKFGAGYMRLLREMEVGDSFWLDKSWVGKAFQNVIRARATELKKKVAVRTSIENDVVGWRVWRIE